MKTIKIIVLFIGMLVLSLSILMAQLIVKGTVSSAKGTLPGVNVLLKGTKIKTLTDIDGHYQIEVQSPKDTLVFSFVGMKTKEVPVRFDKPLDVVLEDDEAVLDEVIVVGDSDIDVEGEVEVEVAGYIPFCNKMMTGAIMDSDNYINESYNSISENDFKKVSQNPLSTFSVDVDRAAYSNVRRMLNDGYLPNPDAVRIEEMINYFEYDYKQPNTNEVLKANTELSTCPWNTDNLLLQIGLQAEKVKLDNLPKSNIVFLIDVSGSMDYPNKLPLVKSAFFRLFVNQLTEEDKVAIVVYAGNSGLVLPATSGDKKQKILEALDKLSAGGSTAGGEGLKLAYKVAEENFIKKGNNRIILATDGDFNVGISSNAEMERLITEKREKGIAISVLGFGIGNYKDDKLEIIADKGNGNYSYIDNLLEAKKVLVNEMGGTLHTIAKDVKLQIEFNPRFVKEYRLIGYENRLLNEEDFEDDKKDAGEIGMGHCVTALYEIVPRKKGEKIEDGLKYQEVKLVDNDMVAEELGNLKIRYKEPKGTKSLLREEPISNAITNLEKASMNLRWAAAVAEFGMLLRDSKHKKATTWKSAKELAKAARGEDEQGYRAEMIRLMETAELLKENKK